MESVIEEIREKYSDLFQYSIDFIYAHDLKGNFFEANDIALKALGYSRDELSNLSFKQLIDEDQIKVAFNVLNEFRETGKQSKLSTYKLRTRDGNAYYFRIRNDGIHTEVPNDDCSTHLLLYLCGYRSYFVRCGARNHKRRDSKQIFIR